MFLLRRSATFQGDTRTGQSVNQSVSQPVSQEQATLHSPPDAPFTQISTLPRGPVQEYLSGALDTLKVHKSCFKQGNQMNEQIQGSLSARCAVGLDSKQNIRQECFNHLHAHWKVRGAYMPWSQTHETQIKIDLREQGEAAKPSDACLQRCLRLDIIAVNALVHRIQKACKSYVPRAQVRLHMHDRQIRKP
eukprot:scaffold6925_cov18-Tisochrysis_lutea.AAC.2